MKHLFLGSVALLALAAAGPAAAADMRVKAPVYKAPTAMVAAHNWTGFYIGGHLGYAQSRLRISENDPDGDEDEVTTDRADGYIAGGQLGFNWQFGQWVIGLEGDLGYLGLENRALFTAPGATAPDDEFATRFALYGTATGRLGFSIDRLLAYAKGGFAFARIRHSVIDFEDAESFEFRATRTGWTAGGGFEYAFTPNWSAKLEYLYMDFGDEAGQNPFETSESIIFDNRVHTVKLGVNYRFGDFGKSPVGKGPVVTRY